MLKLEDLETLARFCFVKINCLGSEVRSLCKLRVMYEVRLPKNMSTDIRMNFLTTKKQRYGELIVPARLYIFQDEMNLSGLLWCHYFEEDILCKCIRYHLLISRIAF